VNSEEKRITNLLQEGKITREQADRLLAALPGQKKRVEKSTIIRSLRWLVLAACIGLLFLLYSIMTSSSISRSPFLIWLTSKADKSHPEDIYSMPPNAIPGEGILLVIKENKKLAFPLLHTDVKGDIYGNLARMYITQLFTNPTDTAIEALYTFPLPENSAADYLYLEVGNKRIRAAVKERAAAQREYERAGIQGKTAGLLEQERPNIFSYTIANILPGDSIRVTLSYWQEIRFRSGTWRFTFPMVVGPRYIPGRAFHPEPRGSINPTDQVTDAHKITAPVLTPRWRNGHRISLTLTLNSGGKIAELESPSHKIKVTNINQTVQTVSLLSNDRIPNKDFVFIYRLSEKNINPLIFSEKTDESEGFFQINLMPQFKASGKQMFPRELVFLVDNSGSMHGYPMKKAGEVLEFALKKMSKRDVFRLITFAGRTRALSKDVLPATGKNITRALDFIHTMEGEGGTEILTAVQNALQPPPGENRKRMVLFLTDGYIGNEQAVLNVIRDKLLNTRVFSLGVGSSVNRYLIESIAYVGGGTAEVIRYDENVEDVVSTLFSSMEAPLLSNIKIEWEGVVTSDMLPKRIPDLCPGQPLVLTGKYHASDSAWLTVSGDVPGQKKFRKRIRVSFGESPAANRMVSVLWARRKIAEYELLGLRMFGHNAYTVSEVKKAVTDLGLTHKLLTRYTSFLAVLDDIRNTSGRWIPVEQVSNLPEGMDREGLEQFAIPESLQTVQGYIEQKQDPVDEQLYLSQVHKGLSPLPFPLREDQPAVSERPDQPMNPEIMKMRFRIPAASEIAMEGQGGRRPAESVAKVIGRHAPELQHVYARYLEQHAGLKGKMLIKFEIGPFGNVRKAAIVGSTTGIAEFDAEILNRVLRWRFEPAGSSGIEIMTVPFVFMERQV
jgi:Ca-activated chloride channel family protein